LHDSREIVALGLKKPGMVIKAANSILRERMLREAK
jgi:hypothetical protein